MRTFALTSGSRVLWCVPLSLPGLPLSCQSCISALQVLHMPSRAACFLHMIEGSSALSLHTVSKISVQCVCPAVQGLVDVLIRYTYDVHQMVQAQQPIHKHVMLSMLWCLYVLSAIRSCMLYSSGQWCSGVCSGVWSLCRHRCSSAGPSSSHEHVGACAWPPLFSVNHPPAQLQTS